jgi:hypothetical protein
LMVKRHPKEMGSFDGGKAPERDGTGGYHVLGSAPVLFVVPRSGEENNAVGLFGQCKTSDKQPPWLYALDFRLFTPRPVIKH